MADTVNTKLVSLGVGITARPGKRALVFSKPYEGDLHGGVGYVSRSYLNSILTSQHGTSLGQILGIEPLAAEISGDEIAGVEPTPNGDPDDEDYSEDDDFEAGDY